MLVYLIGGRCCCFRIAEALLPQPLLLLLMRLLLLLPRPLLLMLRQQRATGDVAPATHARQPRCPYRLPCEPRCLLPCLQEAPGCWGRRLMMLWISAN